MANILPVSLALLRRGKEGSGVEDAEAIFGKVLGYEEIEKEYPRAHILFEFFEGGVGYKEDRYWAIFPEFAIVILLNQEKICRIWFRDERVEMHPIMLDHENGKWGRETRGIEIRWNPTTDVFCIKGPVVRGHLHRRFPKKRGQSSGVHLHDEECTDTGMFTSMKSVFRTETPKGFVVAFRDVYGYPTKKVCEELGWPSLGQRSIQISIRGIEVKVRKKGWPVMALPTSKKDSLATQNPQCTVPWQLQ